MHALGKTLDSSGIDTCAIDSGTYTSAALREIYGGKAYKRGVEYHITTSLAIMMKSDAISSAFPLEPVHAQWAAFRKALRERSPNMVEAHNGILSWYSGNLKPLEQGQESGELGQFLTQYLEQVDNLLCLITACHSGDWEGYLAALENLIKYFFARDLLNYARLMPCVPNAQMNALEQEDCATREALKSGEFVVAKSQVPFTQLFTDQTLKQEIKELKCHGGIVGLSQDEAVLDRLVTTTPCLAHIVKQYLNSFSEASESRSARSMRLVS